MTRILTLLLALPLISIAAPAPKDAPPAYFPTKVGDRLLYERTSEGKIIEHVEEVQKVDTKDGVLHVTIEMGRTKKRASVVEVSDSGLLRRSSGGKELPIPHQQLKLPAKAGLLWKVGDDAKAAAMMGQMVYTIAKVDEVIDTPAGKFKTIRVEAVQAYEDGKSIKVTTWYEARRGIVKQEIDEFKRKQTMVLKSFTAGK